MKTIEIQIYKFDELSEDAKQRAIEKFRNTEDFSYLYEEAYETVKKFHSIFQTSEGRDSWLDVRVNYDDDILNLTGQRLATYLWNNYKNDIYEGKYYGKLVYTDKWGEKLPISKEHPIGARHVKRYSKVFLSNCCVLTGVCYDDSILRPIYDFIEKPNQYNIEDLINFCFDELKNDIESEIDSRNEDEYIIETIEVNEYDFTEDGELY